MQPENYLFQFCKVKSLISRNFYLPDLDNTKKMKKIILCLGLLCFTGINYAQTSDNPYDYKDPESSEGLIRVRHKENYGFINEKGSLVIPLKYSFAGRFNNGLAQVTTKNEGYGYIDKKGKIVIPLKYQAFGDEFNNGYIPAKLNGKWGMINDDGKTIIPHKYDYLNHFSNGVAKAAVLVEGEERYGFVDEKGKEIIPLIYSDVQPFNEGLAAVRKGDVYGFVNSKHEIVIPFQYENVNEFFNEGLVAVKTNGLWGYINTQNKMILPPTFTWAGPFSNGEAKVSKDDNSWYYIDKNGNRLNAGRWLMLYSKGMKFGEQYWNLSKTLDYDLLNKKLDAGFRYTSIIFSAGKQEVFSIMSKNHSYSQTGKTKQSLEKMSQAIDESFSKEGYVLDFINYDPVAKKWMWMASKMPGYEKQGMITHDSYPEKTVEEYKKQGMFIVNMAYGEGKYIIITRKEKYQDQIVKRYRTNKLDSEEMSKILKTGYAITSLVRDRNSFTVVFTKGTGIKEQLLVWEEEIPTIEIKDYWNKGYSLQNTFYIPR